MMYDSFGLHDIQAKLNFQFSISHRLESIFNSYIDFLQRAVLRTVAVEHLIGAGLRAHGIGLGVEEFERLRREHQVCLCGLSGFHLHTLEGAQRLQWAFSILEVAKGWQQNGFVPI